MFSALRIRYDLVPRGVSIRLWPALAVGMGILLTSCIPAAFGGAVSEPGPSAAAAPGVGRRVHVTNPIPVGTYGSDPFNTEATTRAVYVTQRGAGTLTVIDPKTLKVVATVPVGNSPYGVAVNPRRRKPSRVIWSAETSWVPKRPSVHVTQHADIRGGFHPGGRVCVWPTGQSGPAPSDRDVLPCPRPWHRVRFGRWVVQCPRGQSHWADCNGSVVGWNPTGAAPTTRRQTVGGRATFTGSFRLRTRPA
jgi:YVTN family beta-propeller protein